jgi:hypothetical protein
MLTVASAVAKNRFWRTLRPFSVSFDSKTGKSKVHSELVLSERETTIEIGDVANTTYKLNAETCRVCELQRDVPQGLVLLRLHSSRRSALLVP